MKLFELIDPKLSYANIYRSDKGIKHAMDRMHQNDNTTPLGKGKFGQVAQHKNRPGTVIKTGKMADPRSDGYYQYITALAKSKLANSNPYFPRIYSIKTYDNDDGDDMYVVELEKLTPMNQCDPETLMAIGNRAFFNFDKESNIETRSAVRIGQGQKSRRDMYTMPYYGSQKLKKEPITAETLSILISDTMMGNLGSDTITNIKDPLLKQALMFIKTINNRSHRGDLHSENIMVRHGPGGGQLVLTDPLAQLN